MKKFVDPEIRGLPQAFCSAECFNLKNIQHLYDCIPICINKLEKSLKQAQVLSPSKQPQANLDLSNALKQAKLFLEHAPILHKNCPLCFTSGKTNFEDCLTDCITTIEKNMNEMVKEVY